MASVENAIRGLRVINGGMLASLLAISAVAAMFRTVIEPDFDSGMQNLLLGLAGLLAVACPIGYSAIRRNVRAGLLPKVAAIHASAQPPEAVLEPYRRLVVLKAAMIEFPALLGALSYLAGGSAAGLLLTAGGVVLLLATMPSRESLQRFVDGLRE